MEYSIRKALSSDADRVNELFIQMLGAIYQKDSVQGYEKGYLDNFFGSEENLIYVAEIDNRVIAYLSIEGHHEENTPFLYLDDFCVDEEYRGSGIGTQLLTIAVCYAREHNFSRISLHVDARNHRALRLYQKFGFQEENVLNDRIQMAKQL